MPNFTDALIRSAEPGTTLWDESLKGFGLRVGKSRKTFIVLVASGRRYAIGRYPLLSLADARKEARRLLAEKELGHIKPATTSYEKACAQFLSEKNIRPRTRHDYTRLLDRFTFGRMNDITAKDILRQLRAIVGPTERHHAYSVLKVFMRWSVRRQFLAASPLDNIDPPARPKPKERTLSETELRCLCSALQAQRMGFFALVWLLLLTGQRRSEIGALQWEWVQGDLIIFPETKNGRPHTLPIGPMAQALLANLPRMAECPYVFASRTLDAPYNGWGKGKERLDKFVPIAPWTLHDLRRTFATNMQRLGIRLEVTEALLNHVSGSRGGVVGIYQRYHWLPEMREAMLRWEGYLGRLKNRGNDTLPERSVSH